MNYLITVPIHQSKSEEIVKHYYKTLIQNNGPRQCIHVLTHELFIGEIRY